MDRDFKPTIHLEKQKENTDVSLEKQKTIEKITIDLNKELPRPQLNYQPQLWKLRYIMGRMLTS